MRLQRGRHEVKLMVRYPRDERRSLANFDDIRVRTGDGAERPLTELAKVDIQRGYSSINRLDQLRSITITADVDESQGNAKKIVKSLRTDFMPKLLADYPGVSVRWEGQQEQTEEVVFVVHLDVGFTIRGFQDHLPVDVVEPAGYLSRFYREHSALLLIVVDGDERLLPSGR